MALLVFMIGYDLRFGSALKKVTLVQRGKRRNLIMQATVSIISLVTKLCLTSG